MNGGLSLKRSSRLRVGVDVCTWINERGYGRFTRELLTAMVASSPDVDFVYFADEWARASIERTTANVRIVCVDQKAAPTGAAAANSYRSPADMFRLTQAIWKVPMDVFFSPSVYTYFPLPPRIPAVVTIHDAIAEKFPKLTLPTLRARLFWSAKVRLAVWQARLILTVSEYSARDLASELRIPPNRIRVAPEAPSAPYRPSDSKEQILEAAADVGLPRESRWILYVGGFNPHKHVDLIVKAHAASLDLQGDSPLYLVLVGDAVRDVFHSDVERIRKAIAEAGTERLVIWAGFVPDEKLRHLQSGALALLLPSACEGFGLPAVEAAACGTPVIATTKSPLPELLEGGGIFVRPGHEGDLVTALRAILKDEPARRRMGEVARFRTGKLSWERSATVAMQHCGKRPDEQVAVLHGDDLLSALQFRRGRDRNPALLAGSHAPGARGHSPAGCGRP
jgi:glycosyltransferase involved in cell wall biosynthesis